MARGYVEISEACMRSKVQQEMGFTEVFATNTQELLFQRAVTERFAVRIYSSIAAGASRSVGQDAIRVAIFDTVADRPVKMERRVNRTENALYHMHERARELYKHVKHNACSCGAGVFVERKSKTDKVFLGCSAFPACKNTRAAKV
jgi:hypothetical protein